MRGLLLSVWLLGAALYTLSILALIKPFSSDEDWHLPPPVNETFKAKEPRAIAFKPDLELALLAQPAAFVTPPQPKIERHNEWVRIVGYTTVVRARPSIASPAFGAYAAGRPFRVIAREAGFARVQDLGSGQLGWVEETALAPFAGGYQQREDVVEPQLVASAEPQAAAPRAAERQTASAKPHNVAVVVAVKKAPPPRNKAIGALPKKETVAAIEGSDRGLFGRMCDRPQHIALHGDDMSLAAIINRAFSGR